MSETSQPPQLPNASAVADDESKDAGRRRSTYRVFLSHGSADNYIAKELIVPKLSAAGAVVFIDDGAIEYGADFRARIFAELALVDELCLLVTPTSVERPWIFAELGVAIHRQIRVIAVIYGPHGDDLQKKGISSLLGTHLTLPLDDFGRYVEQLRNRIASKNHG